MAPSLFRLMVIPSTGLVINYHDIILPYHFNCIVQCIKIRTEIRVIPRFRGIDLIDRFA